MNTLLPLSKFTKLSNKFEYLSNTSVVVNKKGQPVGFVFGRDAFVAFLEKIDNDFEKKVRDPKEAFNNPAGYLIDLIEDKLTVNPKFVSDLRKSKALANRKGWIPFDEVVNSLHV